MKSVTLSSAEDKNTVRKAVPTSKIFTAGVARLHVASPDPLKWTYSRIWGAAVFCIDKAKNNSFFIRIIDIEGSSGVIWEQELYEGFNYVKEASFFHTFETDDYLTALEFVDEGEADTFYKKVQGRESLTAKANGVGGVFTGNKRSSSISNKRRSKIDKNHIGMPADFRHVGHIGYTAGKGFSVQNNDPELSGIFDQLKALGISADEIQDNQEFINEFLQQNGTALPNSETQQPPPPPPQQQQQQQQYNAPLPPVPSFQNNNNQRKKAPPPPPPPPGRHHAPPPPPPPRRAMGSAPPPPPPTRNITAGPPVPNRNGRPVPPPPPGRNNMPSAPVPPPVMGGAPPPPPPPPMMGGAPPPPPPPAPSGVPGAPPPPPSGIPAPTSGRTDLMASIRAAGGFGTLKSSGKLREAGETADRSSPAVPGAAIAGAATGAAAGAAGGDLASSLANVLKQRQQAMQSDDEDDDDDEWE